MEVPVHRVVLLLGTLAALAGCGGPAVTEAAAVTPTTGRAILPLSPPEHDFVNELETGRTGVDTSDVRKVIGYGYSACTALRGSGTDPDAAVEVIRVDGSLTDATARTVVEAAGTHLCPTS
jgi:hypothetical protein